MKWSNTFLFSFIIIISISFLLGIGQNGSEKRVITIGMIGKMSSNPVFQAAYAGARIAAKELGEQYNVKIVIDWQTPETNNAKEQASALGSFTRRHVDGIAIACSDAELLTPIINTAVDHGIPVINFISDAPKSKRFAYYGVDDIEFGRSILKELAKEMEGEGTIAILAGSQNALNQKLRIQGIKDELKNFPKLSLSLKNIYHHQETSGKAVETLRRAQKANPSIKGWAFLGSWALLQKNSLPWDAGEIKVVAGYAVPEELEYVKSGHVQALIGVNCCQAGYKSIEFLVEKILKNHEPEHPMIYDPLVRVSKGNLDEWQLKWNKWLVKDAVNR
jgi:ribose transport system substrate-binding protein